MSEKFTYQEYVTDNAFLQSYNAYQAKYAERIRESDKKLIALVDEFSRTRAERSKLLDIGCSTGNLLLHLVRTLPDKIDLVGGDLAESSLEVARANPELGKISFELLDITKLPKATYDIVVVNCVLYMMTGEQYRASLQSIAASLKPGGAVFIYDFAHKFPQEIEINEVTASHPAGLRLCFRSEKTISEAFRSAGFSDWSFMPFELPLDLPKIDHETDIITYTRKDEFGERLAFRGTLYQPWCHMVARKAS